MHVDMRHVGGEWQEVIAKIDAERLRVVVINEAFEPRIADPMGNTANHLAIDNRGIDHATALVENGVTQDQDLFAGGCRSPRCRRGLPRD